MHELTLLKLTPESVIHGVKCFFSSEMKTLKEPLLTCNLTGVSVAISGGCSTCNHIITKRGETVFSKAECHDEDEMFYFLSGTSTMLFADGGFDSEITVLESPCCYVIPPQTVVIVQRGKYHYIGPSLTPNSECVIVTSSRIKTQLLLLGENDILGVNGWGKDVDG